jgi:hypothetical protein
MLVLSIALRLVMQLEAGAVPDAVSRSCSLFFILVITALIIHFVAQSDRAACIKNNPATRVRRGGSRKMKIMSDREW